MIARRERTMIARRGRDGVAAVPADTQQCHNNAKTLDKLFRLAFISGHWACGANVAWGNFIVITRAMIGRPGIG